MRRRWWLFGENRPGLRKAIANIHRCIVTPEVSKHRIFIWMDSSTIPDHTLHVVARDDDYFFGVLHSRIHEIWSLKVGSTLEDRPRYSSSRVFETFPFPWPPGQEPVDDPRVQAIAEAAKELVEQRERWLTPSPPMPSAGPPPNTTMNTLNAISKSDWSDLPLQDASRGEVSQRDGGGKRTLTNLYNARPTWLNLAHKRLDEAVFAAYGWKSDLSDEEILEKLLALNLERAKA
ncbi:MAG TPA: type IIL restriction-modification enzyme MmeI [Anaerolineales bacterium]|nr:type IIL restriction-modification enzyme MmeI [Anaerolineales bacterium]